jgi:hypothetical protein
MHRLLVLALLALGLTIVFAPTATPAAPSDAQGPPCANITDRDIFYGENGVIDFTLFLQAPACSFVNYSFFVTDTDGNPVPGITTQDDLCTPDPGEGCVHFVYNVGTNGPLTVCYSATTDIQGQHVADIAPNVADPTCQGLPIPSFSVGKGGSGSSGGFG